MFYSEQLLSKTGPLARVWLASNVERKLSKSQILQSDISSSVGVIVDQGQAPMALRLSGQLMLGVVRIYGRQARYLLDDCNEALLKIRMTFKSGNNHDLPNQTATTIDLNLPEHLTIDDLFPAMDFAFPLTQQPAFGENTQRDLIDFDEDWTSSLNPQTQSIHSGIRGDDEPGIQDDDLGLDLGEEVGLDDTTISMQMGRRAESARPDEPSVLPAYDDGEDDLGLDLGENVDMPDVTTTYKDNLPIPNLGEDDDMPVQLGDEDETAAQRRGSIMSDTVPDIMQQLDRTFAQPEEEEEQEVEEVVAQQRQQIRRHKPMIPDAETVIGKDQLKAFGEDRSKILKPASSLTQDPVLLALINMQKSGAFVTNAMNDGRSRDWAPELQGLLSFEVVHRSGQLKRKRDSGIADISDDEHSDKSPRLDRNGRQIDQLMLEDEGVQIDHRAEQAIMSDPIEVHDPVDTVDPALDDAVPGEDDEGIYIGEGGGDFDNTTMPLVHPADSGPISVGTKRAVHLLRETFGGSSAEASPRKQVLLQDLIPERSTSKEDATKMFFETLVLATKDAIKVDQQTDKHQIGLPIRVRAKRGLWGAWAEAVPVEPGSTQQQASMEVGVTA